MADQVTAGDVMVALKRRYPDGEYALLPQVANGTGYAATRHCDALALSLWPSRGIRLHGFEIKVYRSDWLRELKNPAKAETIAKRCHHWWIVAPPKVVEPFELPPTWGLLELRGTKLHVVRQAPDLEPPAIDLLFVAAMLRAAAGQMPGKVELEAAEKRGHTEGIAEGKRQAAYEVQRGSERHEQLRRAVDQFERTSGIRIEEYRGEQLGAVFAQVLALEGDWNGPARKLQRIHELAGDLLERTTALLEVPPPGPDPFLTELAKVAPGVLEAEATTHG